MGGKIEIFIFRFSHFCFVIENSYMEQKFENFSDGVSVLYIIGLGAKVRPPCFDSGCYSRES